MEKKPVPISIVIPMYNAGKYIGSALGAIFSQEYNAPMEVIVVNDGSVDDSLEIVKGLQNKWDFMIIDQQNQGAVKATNNGFQRASHEIIFSIDSDVVLNKDFFRKIVGEFSDPDVAAVQGYYKTPEDISLWGRLMGYDVEARYDAIKSKYVTQVCSGDTAYRKTAIERAGAFDAAFKYGYDNDMSYRLIKAGYKLVFRKDALCDHYWKAKFRDYMKQQYLSAFGRMQLIAKHKDKVSGDSVSGLRMIMQVPLTLLVFLLLTSGLIALFLAPATGRFILYAALGTLGIILIDRLMFAFGVLKKQRDMTALFLPFVHLLRNIVWCWALLKWMKSGRELG